VVVQSSKQDPRLLEEVGDLSVYLTYLKSAVFFPRESSSSKAPFICAASLTNRQKGTS